ncbi:putative secreted protein [Fusarium oxysporum f. sp. albedinis]|nr:putative secreted protein [Fusarium oxysporum f. sp. albedinis]
MLSKVEAACAGLQGIPLPPHEVSHHQTIHIKALFEILGAKRHHYCVRFHSRPGVRNEETRPVTIKISKHNRRLKQFLRTQLHKLLLITSYILLPFYSI